MLTGLTGGIDRLASLAVFLSFTALSLFFLLKDAPTIGGWVERHVGLPVPLAHAMLGRIASSLRGYFLGVTIVAAWSALIVGIGPLLLGVPLAGTIAVVTFLGGYIPYLGAWVGRRLRGADRPRRVGPRDGDRARGGRSCSPTASSSSWSSRSPTAPRSGSTRSRS